MPGKKKRSDQHQLELAAKLKRDVTPAREHVMSMLANALGRGLPREALPLTTPVVLPSSTGPGAAGRFLRHRVTVVTPSSGASDWPRGRMGCRWDKYSDEL